MGRPRPRADWLHAVRVFSPKGWEFSAQGEAKPTPWVRWRSVMRFGVTRSQIFDAQKSTAGKWYLACEAWDDAVRREHGEQVVEELDKAVSEVLRGIDLVATLFVQIRQECEFPGS